MRRTKRNRVLSCLLIAVLLIPLFSGLTAKADAVIGRADHQMVDAPGYTRPNPPDINSDTAIVVEMNSGVVLYAKDIHRRMYPASITKIITALIALETLELDDKLVLSYNSVTDLVEGGQDGRGRFYEGQSFTVEDAVYALSLNSVNTVGYALAEKIDGNLPAFSERMNKRARELGAINTTFNNPHGLNDLSHMTTAYDMAMIMWGAVQNDLYRKIAGTRSYSFQDNNGVTITCDHNYLVFQPDSPYYDSRIVAGKTGWVEEAEYTRTVYATDGNLDVLCVTFHADTTANAYEDVRNLLDYAFNNFSLVQLPEFGDQGEVAAAVQDDRTGEEGILHLTTGKGDSVTGAAVLVPNSYARMDWSTQLVPDEKGELKAVASLGGVILGTYPLSITVTRETVPPTTPEENTQSPSASTGEPGSSAFATTAAGATTALRSTTAPSGSRSGEAEPAESGGGWKTVLIVFLAVALLFCLVYCLLLARQNKVLKERMRRRKVIKKTE